MRGICGWFGDPAASDADARLQRMLAAGGAAGAHDRRHTDPSGAAAGAFGSGAVQLVAADGCVLAITGHPRWTGGAAHDSGALARALRTQGADALASLGGDFALAFWDSRSGRGLLAIDRIGVHQLVFAHAQGQLVFASTLDVLRAHPSCRRSLSAQGLYDYLYHHVSPGPETVFEGLTRVPPGHCIEFADSAVRPARPYWSLRFAETRSPQLPALEQQFRDVVEQSVRDASAAATCGTFLSGGTDSSTVSGMLARVQGRAQTFSIGFDAAGYDEMDYARLAAKHFGCEHHEYYVTPDDVVNAVPRIAKLYDQPFGNASAIPTYYCARMAREHGITRLLAGDGGDELFGGNERYAKHHLLGLYQHVPAALRRALIEPLLLGADVTARIPLLKKLRSYVEQARPPMPQRYESTNLLHHLGPANVFAAEFLASVDTHHPTQRLQQCHEPHGADSLINQMLAIDLRFILADGDLPKVTRVCELADVDVAFPLLDERVVAFSTILPARYKLRGTQLRWFFKHALREFLPQQILVKQKHGFGLPVGAWLVQHAPLRRLARDAVDTLRPRRIIRDGMIDELFGSRLEQHPAYFGTMIWILMMLGLWLESRDL